MQIDLAWLKKKVDPVQPDLLDKLDAMNQIAESTLATVRRVSAELRPGFWTHSGCPPPSTGWSGISKSAVKSYAAS